MKNLANCKPSEFIAQTVKIKKIASKWLEEIDWTGITSEPVNLKEAPPNASAEERAAVIKANAEIIKKKGMERMSKLFDNAFEKCPDDTLAVLALCCFVEPQDVDNHPMSEYLGCITELVSSKEVTDFFTFLATLRKAI